jgi:hypothetical protein
VFLGGHGGTVRRGVNGQVQVLFWGVGEAGILSIRPLHGRAHAGADITALLGGKRLIAHAEFVTVVDEGRAGHGQQEQVDQFQLGGVTAVSQPRRFIVVAGDQGDVALVVGCFQVVQIFIQELADIPVPGIIKEGPGIRVAPATLRRAS